MIKKSIHYIQMPSDIDSDGMRVIKVYDQGSDRLRIPVGCSLQPEPDETSTVAKAVRDLMVYSKANGFIDRETVNKVFGMIEDGIIQGSFCRENVEELIVEAEKFDNWVTEQQAEVKAATEKTLDENESESTEADFEDVIDNTVAASGAVEVLVSSEPNTA